MCRFHKWGSTIMHRRRFGSMPVPKNFPRGRFGGYENPRGPRTDESATPRVLRFTLPAFRFPVSAFRFQLRAHGFTDSTCNVGRDLRLGWRDHRLVVAS